MVWQRQFDLSGGRLCLDLVNTIDNRPTDRIELLLSYRDLLSWSRQAGILSPKEVLALAKRAKARPAAAARALDRARRIREALFAVFSRETGGGLEALRTALPTAYRRPILRRSRGRGYALDWDRDPKALDSMLGPVLRSAVELLTSSDLGRVRVCGAWNCDWLFLDESRNRSRQWCNMRVCGNRSKARRFYRRNRALKRRGSRGGRRFAGTRGRPARG